MRMEDTGSKRSIGPEMATIRVGEATPQAADRRRNSADGKRHQICSSKCNDGRFRRKCTSLGTMSTCR